jgi:glc operon protein GlcG
MFIKKEKYQMNLINPVLKQSKSLTGRAASMFIAASFVVAGGLAQAQTASYGSNIVLEQANRAVAASLAEARKLNLNMAIAVVDTAGQLITFSRMDNTQTGSIGVSQDKASSAAMFRRPTKAFQDAVAGGGAGLRVLTLRGANAVEGGVPLVVDGKIIGAIGVSGGSAEQDGVVAKAGVDVLVK